MATSYDLGGNNLYVNDLYTGDNTPGSLSGTSVGTGVTNIKTQLASLNQWVSTVGLATAGLTTAQSGIIVALNNASGTTISLPAPQVGLNYTFVVGTVGTANKIITDAGTTFIAGGLYIDKALTITRYDANGTSIRSINLNGTTTGGATTGDVFTLICYSPTQWTVEGTVTGSGTLSTPFATS